MRCKSVRGSLGQCFRPVSFLAFFRDLHTFNPTRPPAATACLPMNDFSQQRHKPPTELERPRDLVVACPPMRSNVNLSRIARAAACCGVRRMICCGTAKLIDKIARDGAEAIEIEIHRTLPPVLKTFAPQGYQLVGLEQTGNSKSLYEFPFERKTLLVIGNERQGIAEELLAMLDHTVEIPVYGLPYSHNAATATAIALYEYCRQFPKG